MVRPYNNAMPCCGDIADALAYLESNDSGGNPAQLSGGNSACIRDDVYHGDLFENVEVDDFWVNFCCGGQFALPFFLASKQPDVKGGVRPRRQITFVDKPVVVTFVIADELFQRQTPPTSYLTTTTIGREIIVDEEYLYFSAHSAAVARSKALDLSCAWAVDGRTILPLLPNKCEVDMSCEFVACNGKEQSCDMPCRVLFWENDRVLSFVPDRDGYASYGRPLAYWVQERVYTIKLATTMSKGKPYTYEHLGKIPSWAWSPEVQPVRRIIRYVDSTGHSAAASPLIECSPAPRQVIILKTPARPVRNGIVVEPPWFVASPAEGTIKIWLVDAGCGHDLIGKNEVASSGGVCRPTKESLTFNTANGKTVAQEQASYQSTELNEEIDAYVLESTPAVISVGKRCMDMGYRFHRPACKNHF